MLFDANCYLGAWPFGLMPELSPSGLLRHLQRSGIARAAVSPLDAVFAPEPMPANRRLFSAVRREHRLVPLPVVNPRLANWREQLAECAAGARVSAVRLMPAYHGYRLRAVSDRFLTELAEAGLKPVLTVRLEDERQRYFALNVKGVPVADIAAFLARCPRMTALCTGLAVGEALQLAEAADNFLADLAYMENIELAALLRPRLPPRRLLFGTLTPMLSAQAQTAKLAHRGFSATERRVVGFGNARRFFE
ncbi:MAG: hypothetical protein JNG82_03425 [Opitutaceae bacterium]|nr:hypothetical protein [Opitutaceae bacterium]